MYIFQNVHKTSCIEEPAGAGAGDTRGAAVHFWGFLGIDSVDIPHESHLRPFRTSLRPAEFAGVHENVSNRALRLHIGMYWPITIIKASLNPIKVNGDCFDITDICAWNVPSQDTNAENAISIEGF